MWLTNDNAKIDGIINQIVWTNKHYTDDEDEENSTKEKKQ